MTTLLLLVAAACAISIESFGAVSEQDTLKASFTNAEAIFKTFQAANASTTDRTVEIPASRNYFMVGVPVLQSLNNVVLQFDGNLTFLTNITAWPNATNKVLNGLTFSDCTYITVTGNGVFDGQGYIWWNRAIENRIVDGRPSMILMESCANVLFENTLYRNSPQYHLYLYDMANLTVRGVRVWVNVTQQKEMLSDHGLMTAATHEFPSLPTFPLNTDGIDPAGINVHIDNVTIENYDDAVAVKPMHGAPGGGKYSDCSSNILVENSRVVFGVGMTIGSVPPNPGVNCVRNVTFRNIDFTYPFKAIYVKTNPGDHGTGIISDITYENISITDALWWTIYIGPQQQKQPDGTGPGCMLYPLNPDCPTDPRVPITNITLRNVTAVRSLLNAGILRCNVTNPCTGFVFDNVNVQGGDWPREGYICENVHGVAHDSRPFPSCFNASRV